MLSFILEKGEKLMLAWIFIVSNVAGFLISFIFNLIYNRIQKKESRHKITFGTVMGWGVFLSIIIMIALGLLALGI